MNIRRNVSTALVVVLVLFASTSARAIPLPDTSSCSNAAQCLRVTNTHTSGNGLAVGVMGEGRWAGVAGDGRSYGVYGSSGNGALGGVYGAAIDGVGVKGRSVYNDGVYGSTSDSGRSGVAGFGAADGIGVFGLTPGYGTGSAIYGSAGNSATAFAGYFDGRVRATNYVTASDLRLKKEIQNLPYGLQEVGKLRPVAYKWKAGDRGQHRQLGLIAQEVQETMPELVDADAKSGMLSVNYQALAPVVIKALQEQQVLIKRQEARIAALEKLQAPTLSSSMGALALGLLPLGLIAVWRDRRWRRAP